MAQAVVSRKSRDLLRAALGPDLVFIVFNLTNKCQVQRVEARQPGEEMKGIRDSLYEMYKAYEPAEEDEPSSFNVQIDENMTPADVMKKVLDIINQM